MPLWSKLESGRIPQPGELLQIIGKPTNRSINQFCCFLLTNAPAGLGGYQSCHDEIVIHVMFNNLLAAGCRKPHQDGIRRCGRGRRRPGPDWGLQPRRVVVNLTQSMGSRYNQPTSASHFYTEHSPEQFYRRMYHYFGILFNVCTVQSVQSE